jgi:hypothetical protein
MGERTASCLAALLPDVSSDARSLLCIRSCVYRTACVSVALRVVGISYMYTCYRMWMDDGMCGTTARIVYYVYRVT